MPLWLTYQGGCLNSDWWGCHSPPGFCSRLKFQYHTQSTFFHSSEIYIFYLNIFFFIFNYFSLKLNMYTSYYWWLHFLCSVCMIHTLSKIWLPRRPVFKWSTNNLLTVGCKNTNLPIDLKPEFIITSLVESNSQTRSSAELGWRLCSETLVLQGVAIASSLLAAIFRELLEPSAFSTHSCS